MRCVKNVVNFIKQFLPDTQKKRQKNSDLATVPYRLLNDKILQNLYQKEQAMFISFSTRITLILILKKVNIWKLFARWM
jgi:hypothetical protein